LIKKKMELSKKEIEHIAWLARIKLSKKELNLFADQLNDILAYFAKIDEIDTAKVSPAYHVLDLVNVYRKDEVKPSLEETFRTAPQTKGKFVKAPRMA